MCVLTNPVNKALWSKLTCTLYVWISPLVWEIKNIFTDIPNAFFAFSHKEKNWILPMKETEGNGPLKKIIIKFHILNRYPTWDLEEDWSKSNSFVGNFVDSFFIWWFSGSERPNCFFLFFLFFFLNKTESERYWFLLDWLN